MVATTFGVVPVGVLWPFHADNGFWLYDASAVIIETLTAELRLTDPDEIRVYTRVHIALADVAVYGTAARALIASAIAALPRNIEQS